MQNDRRNLLFYTALFLCGAALAYVLAVVVRERIDQSDFRYIWLAGALWSEGATPYGPRFVAVAGEYIPNAILPVTPWVYPPYWYGPAVLTAMLPYMTAFRLMLFAGLAVVIGGGALVRRAAVRQGYAMSPARTLALLAFTLSSTAVVWTIRTGQPLLAALLGICVIIWALQSGRRGWLTVGIVLALLKPHLGLPFVAPLIFLPRTILPLGIAGAIVAILSIPALLIDPPLTILRAMSGSSYGVIAYNTPAQMQGVAHILYGVGVTLPMSLYVLLATAVSCAGVWFHRSLPDYVRICAVSTCFIMTGHGYDMAVLFVILPFVREIGLVVAFALIWRAENVARLVHNVSADILTLAGGIAFATVMIELLRRRRHGRPAEPGGAMADGAVAP